MKARGWLLARPAVAVLLAVAVLFPLALAPGQEGADADTDAENSDANAPAQPENENSDSADPVDPPSALLDPEKLLDYIDDLYKGDSAHGRMTMKIVTANWNRTISMEFWSKGKEKSLFRILSPPRERGMAMLRDGDSIWNYLPRVNRVIRLNSAMMGDAWAGSHMTNNDLVRESRMADDYTFAITFRGKKRNYDVIEITCTPTENAAVEWGKLVLYINEATMMPMIVRYYDEDLDLARTLSFHRVKRFGTRTLPSLMRVVPKDKPGESTIITYDSIEFDLELRDDLFSIRNLQR